MTSPDYYADVRRVLLEAERQSSAIAPRERSKKLERVLELLSRAGYLEDASRIAAKIPDRPFSVVNLGLARVLYRGLDAGLPDIRNAHILPEQKTGAYTRLAHMLWALKKKKEAMQVLDIAAASAQTLAPAMRQSHLGIIKVLRDSLDEEAPRPLSVEPTPSPRPATPAFDPFPITVAGFRDTDAELNARRQTENAPYLQKLYAMVAAGDLKGAIEHARSAASAFQKTLGLATVQHLAAQVKALDLAEQIARSMPDDVADCKLAKAEALASLGVSYAKAEQNPTAVECFEDARTLVRTVSNDMAFGRAVVMCQIGVKQAEVGHPASAQETFREALDLTTKVPQNRDRLRGIYRPNQHFRNDAFWELMKGQILAKDLAGARATAQHWYELEGSPDKISIAGLWVQYGRLEDALAFATSLHRMDCVDALLAIASDLLNEAGAPVY